MDHATATATPEILDAIQVARGRVPINEFRLLPDCPACNRFADSPATPATNADLRDHVRSDHGDLVIVSSD